MTCAARECRCTFPRGDTMPLACGSRWGDPREVFSKGWSMTVQACVLARLIFIWD